MDISCIKYHLKVILDARYSRKLYRDENSLGAEARQFYRSKNVILSYHLKS
jgi:hypothetical protein